jgi:hypothetical protein
MVRRYWQARKSSLLRMVFTSSGVMRFAVKKKVDVKERKTVYIGKYEKMYGIELTHTLCLYLSSAS